MECNKRKNELAAKNPIQFGQNCCGKYRLSGWNGDSGEGLKEGDVFDLHETKFYNP